MTTSFQTSVHSLKPYKRRKHAYRVLKSTLIGLKVLLGGLAVVAEEAVEAEAAAEVAEGTVILVAIPPVLHQDTILSAVPLTLRIRISALIKMLYAATPAVRRQATKVRIAPGLEGQNTRNGRRRRRRKISRRMATPPLRLLTSASFILASFVLAW